MNWYYVNAGQQTGPISENELVTLAGSGNIQPDTLVWCEGMATWLPFSQTKPGGAVNAPPVIAAGPGLLSPRETTAAAAVSIGMAYGGFWIRFVAKLVDGLVLDILLVPFVLIFIPKNFVGPRGPPTPAEIVMLAVVVLGGFALFFGYNTFFVGKFGATPGKMVCGLRVISPEGAPISYARALGRCAAEILSNLFCDLGYIIAAFDSQKRSLHDHIANTRVIKSR